MLAPNGLTEFEGLREADVSQAGGEFASFDTSRFRPSLELAIEKYRKSIERGLRQREPQLKTPPYRAIQQFGVVRRRDGYHIARQLIDLHQ